jgi:Cof subfamily protein (haloacid dehalogenase superfamily)
MIKLIASDLDGTLLDANGRLPESAFDVIAPIVAAGVLFIPASGRQYESLKSLFSPLVEKTAFICENGALVKYLGATIHLDPIPLESVKRILAAAKNIPNVHVIYCGEQTAFVESDYEPFFSHTAASYPCHKKVDSLEEIIGIEPCCKIALYSTISAKTQAYPAILPHLDDFTSATLSGGHWCDVMSKTANKGEAMKAVQRLFGVKEEECIAFGDHLNDLQLLRSCKTTFAPENAQAEIKAIATEIIPSNADMGVLYTLKRLFLIGGN